VINKNGLTDVVITVVRIFGGILLGAGGLTRAYSGSAAAAVSAAHTAFFEEYEEYGVSVEYTEYQKLVHEITSCGGIVTDSEFGSDVKLSYTSPSRIAQRIHARIISVTNGKRVPSLKRKYFDEERN
jgi:putative IMPACT (imprinted ancient) family translation regulator